MPALGTIQFRQLLFVVYICTPQTQVYIEVPVGTTLTTFAENFHHAGDTLFVHFLVFLESGAYTDTSPSLFRRESLYTSPQFPTTFKLCFFLPHKLDYEVSTHPMSQTTAKRCKKLFNEKRPHANMLRAWPIHIAVNDKAPECTFAE